MRRSAKEAEPTATLVIFANRSIQADTFIDTFIFICKDELVQVRRFALMEWRLRQARSALGILLAMMTGCLGRTGHPPPPDLVAYEAILELRAAEDQYQRRSGRYGSLDDLIRVRDRRLAGSLNWARKVGYVVTLEAHENGYSIRGIPEEKRRGQYGWTRTFYADETRVIRASDTSVNADKRSDVARQDGAAF